MSSNDGWFFIIMFVALIATIIVNGNSTYDSSITKGKPIKIKDSIYLCKKAEVK